MLRRIAMVLILALPGLFPAMAQQESSSPEEFVVILDKDGTRGIVFFNHKSHQLLVNPDPAYKFKASKAGACAGCHHTKSESGVIQLWSCRSCHGYETSGPAAQARSKMYADDAFHGNCISCHRAEKRGPLLCTGCHKMRVGQ